MDYVGNVIRPPSEAKSMIIQVTVGCSHNQCTFCGTYKGQKFYLKDIARVKKDIVEMSGYGIPFEKAFLADGDVLILPTETILDIMSFIFKMCPTVKRIGVYGNTKAILKKSPGELKELRDAGLGILYQGIETGNRELLKKIKKGAFPHKQVETAQKIIEAGILLSQTVLLGIGGTEMSEIHAIDTGKLLGEMSPDYASALTVMLLPNTELYRDYKEGKFQLPDKFGMLQELKLIVENMDVHRPCFFASNHASNYLPIRAKFPEEKDKIVSLINSVIEKKNTGVLRPEFMRAL
ncbi:MAG TPA: radical SAM protein [Spirochaetota bacterium]|nr:radical SAM protein [Spirochaetota bacterium]